jgi:hypothetical protein
MASVPGLKGRRTGRDARIDRRARGRAIRAPVEKIIYFSYQSGT